MMAANPPIPAARSHGLFFSPTGTTRKIVRSVCRGTGNTGGFEVDLTFAAPEKTPVSPNDLVVVGMPVYGGRLPEAAVERLGAFQGEDTPLAAIAVYGNRGYGDALLELCAECASRGFRVIGAAAFIGEHSFSSTQFPIAPERPDQADRRLAERFGREIAQAQKPVDFSRIPGQRPYKTAMQTPGAAAESNAAKCVRCEKCVSACPVNAIHLEHGRLRTAPEKCLWCAACVKICPIHARAIALPQIREIAHRLHSTCQTRKEPEWILAPTTTIGEKP